MPRVDFGNLYKFVASVGLVILFAAIALPWFVLSASNSLLLSQEEIEKLSESAASAIAVRQSQLTAVVTWYPVASLLLFACGVGLCVYGFRRWRERQLVEDDITNIKRNVDRASFERMTPAEIEAKLDADVVGEARTVVIENVDVDAPPGVSDERGSEEETDQPASGDQPAPGGPVSVPSGTQAGEIAQSTIQIMEQPRWQAHRAEFERIERLLTQKLTAALSRTHIVSQNMKFRSGFSSLMIDAVAQGRYEDVPDILFEFKVSSSGLKNRTMLSDGAIRLARAAGEKSTSVRVRVGVLVIVLLVPLQKGPLTRLRAEWEGLSGALNAAVGCVLVDEETLTKATSAEIKHIINAAIGDPRMLIDATPGGH